MDEFDNSTKFSVSMKGKIVLEVGVHIMSPAAEVQNGFRHALNFFCFCRLVTAPLEVDFCALGYGVQCMIQW
jgi:hypothetical protein